MTISDLVDILLKIQAKEGNIEVVYYDSVGDPSTSLPFVMCERVVNRCECLEGDCQYPASEARYPGPSEFAHERKVYLT